MRNQQQNENVAERFYIDLKGPIGVFIPELHLIIFLWKLKCLTKYFVSFKNIGTPPFDLITGI